MFPILYLSCLSFVHFPIELLIFSMLIYSWIASHPRFCSWGSNDAFLWGTVLWLLDLSSIHGLFSLDARRKSPPHTPFPVATSISLGIAKSSSVENHWLMGTLYFSGILIYCQLYRLHMSSQRYCVLVNRSGSSLFQKPFLSERKKELRKKVYLHVKKC